MSIDGRSVVAKIGGGADGMVSFLVCRFATCKQRKTKTNYFTKKIIKYFAIQQVNKNCQL